MASPGQRDGTSEAIRLLHHGWVGALYQNFKKENIKLPTLMSFKGNVNKKKSLVVLDTMGTEFSKRYWATRIYNTEFLIKFRIISGL